MQVEVGEGFNVPEAKMKHPRNGEDVNGLRSHQAVACKKRYTRELGKHLALETRKVLPDTVLGADAMPA